MVEPLKKRKGLFPKLRERGRLGEEKVDEYLRSQGYRLVSLRFEAPCDECDKIEDWRKFRKLPEGIAKKGDELFFYESKFKTKKTLYINIRDYNEYLKLIDVLPLKVFFYVEATDSIYVHDVTDLSYPEKFMYDKNRVYDVRDFVRKLK